MYIKNLAKPKRYTHEYVKFKTFEIIFRRHPQMAAISVVHLALAQTARNHVVYFKSQPLNDAFLFLSTSVFYKTKSVCNVFNPLEDFVSKLLISQNQTKPNVGTLIEIS